MIRSNITVLSLLNLRENDYDIRQTKEHNQLPYSSFHLSQAKTEKGKAKVEQVEVLHTDARAP